MAAQSYRKRHIAGDSLTFRVRYTAAGIGVVWTGYSAELAFAWAQGTFKLTSSENLSLDADGWIRGVVPADVTEDWPSGRNVGYRLQLTEPTGTKRTILHGEIDVTRIRPIAGLAA